MYKENKFCECIKTSAEVLNCKTIPVYILGKHLWLCIGESRGNIYDYVSGISKSPELFLGSLYLIRDLYILYESREGKKLFRREGMQLPCMEFMSRLSVHRSRGCRASWRRNLGLEHIAVTWYREVLGSS